MTPDAREPVVEMLGIATRYGDVVVHKDLDLRVEAGDVVGLVGGSGSGKTTLLREMLGLLQPAAGRIKLFGYELNQLDALDRRALRRRLGMLFQQGALFSALPVYDNIAFPLRELKCLDEDWIRHLVHLKLAMVELEPLHGRLMPAELSGGMVKRVALARALALEPELLLLDEPTAGLDPDRSEGFVHLIRQLQRELGFSVVMVTHDLETLAGLSSKIAVLADQRIVAFGTPAEAMAVDHPFIRNFFCSERGLAILSKAVD
ncbi:MAG: transporter related protein [Rhodocyclaceae bacterium]|nr:transporter related protein [Rhodocyclaceae bacterium]